MNVCGDKNRRYSPREKIKKISIVTVVCCFYVDTVVGGSSCNVIHKVPLLATKYSTTLDNPRSLLWFVEGLHEIMT